MTQYKTGKITIHGRLGDEIIFATLYTSLIHSTMGLARCYKKRQFLH